MTNSSQDYTALIEIARKTGIPVENNQALTAVIDLAKSYSDKEQSLIRINEEREKSKIRMDEYKAKNRLNKETIGSVTLSFTILVALSLGGFMLALGSEADRERGRAVVTTAIVSALVAYGARGLRNIVSSSLKID